jgi:hypothetical protein
MSKSRRLTGLAIAVAVIGALVVVQAFAATTTWKGNGTNDTAITVSFKKVSGHPSKVKDWKINHLHFTCHNTPNFRSGTSLQGTISQVHNGKFSYHKSHYNSDHTIKYTDQIDGQFVSKTKATGTYKERRELDSDPTTYCVSAREPWKATKQ